MTTTTAAPQRPIAMPLNPAGLPDDTLLRQAQIVVWGFTWSPEKGKWDKPPIRPLDGLPRHTAAVTTTRDGGRY